METLGNIYGNRYRHVTRRVKLTETSQLRELVHSIAVEQLPEYELACGSELAWKCGEGEAIDEQ
jgi:hypothetical protein